MTILLSLLRLLSVYWHGTCWVSYDLTPRRETFKAQIAQLKERK
jgi:hypothetical protein